MNQFQVMLWCLIVVGTLTVLVAHWLVAWALFPACVEGCRERYSRRPVAATLIGLVLLVPALLLAIGIGQAMRSPMEGPQRFALLSLLVVAFAVPFLLGMIGSAGLALRIGAGLTSDLDARQPWRRMLRGGVVLSLVFLAPWVGWFVVLPWTLASGIGAAAMTLFGRRYGRLPTTAPTTPEGIAPPRL
jgi:hypothetical protein